MKKLIPFLLFILWFSWAPGQQKKFGALPMDNNKLKKIQVLMSKNKKLQARATSTATYARGKADKTPPTVTIISPANGQNFDLNALVNISVSYSDNRGVTASSISIDGVTKTTQSTYTWLATASGQHSISAYARDAAGNTRTATIQITVNTIIITPPPPPPPVDTTPTPPPPPVLPAKVDLAMPAVQYQGGSGTCVGFAIAYARDAGTGQIFSPAYIFDRITTSLQCSGAGLITGCDFLRDTGDCKWSTVPYIDGSCLRSATTIGDAEAGQFRAKSYSQVLSSDVTAIKTILAGGKPLVFQCTVDNNFYYAKAGFIWNSYGTAMGIHALCMCGYDDAKHAFKIINSWGISWGDAGYGWIDYDFYKTACSNLLVFNY